jgi:small-conductance mechanosensitive channel
MRLLDKLLAENTTSDWLVASGILITSVIILFVLRRVGLRRLRITAHRTATIIDDLLIDALRATHVWLLAPVVLYLASEALTLPSRPATVLTRAAVIALLFQVALWGNRGIAVWMRYSLRTKAMEDPASVSAHNVLGYIARVALWALVVLAALDNLGFNITALLAGLGIGGVAVALAAQSVLGDLFASLSIIFDRPFVIGDFIVTGEQMGTVEYIGLKTTRIRSLSGEQIVFSNSDLLKSRIHNYKRMNERRVLFRFGVVYQTPPDVLETIPSLIRSVIEQIPRTRFDRAHFHNYGDSSLDFEVVYYILDRDYNIYMDVQQDILFALYRRLQERGIEIAYPTRTLYLNTVNATP